MSSPFPQRITREIEHQHKLLQEWLASPCAADVLERIATVHAPSFSMITTDGGVLGLTALLDGLARANNTRAGLTIAVRDVEVLATSSELAVARFTEIHAGVDDATSRRVTALMRPDDHARNGVLWLHVHETAMAPDHDGAGE